MEKNKVKDRYYAETHGGVPIIPPKKCDYLKPENRKLHVAIYCRVATQEPADLSEEASAAYKAYAEIAGGSYEEG